MSSAPVSRPLARVSPALRILAWLSFIAEVVIIATGGTVRLTGSGLGCSEWPLCTPDSLVPTGDLGIHGAIEFGNRTMTGVVGVLALAVLFVALARIGGRRHVLAAVWFALGGIALGAIAFAVIGEFWAASAVLVVVVTVAAIHSVSTAPDRRDLLALAWIVLVGVVAQALVGGIAVLTELDAFVVGFHYTASLALVCVTAAFLVRLHAAPGPRELAVPRWYAALAHGTSLVLAVTIFFGILTTASGPHSGDDDVVRDGFDATIVAHVHSWPGYVLAALTLVIVGVAWARRLPTRGWSVAFLVALVVQIVVGVWQANAALPPVLVGIHMVLASLTAAAYVATVLRLKRPVAA